MDGAEDGAEPVDAGAGAPQPAQGNQSPFLDPAMRPRAAVREELDRHGLADVLPPERRFATVRAAVLATTGVDVEAMT